MKKSFVATTIIAAAVIFSSTSALAGDGDAYVSGSLGWTSHLDSVASTSSAAFGFGYRLNRQTAIEVTYANLASDAKINLMPPGGKFSLKSASISGLYFIPTDNKTSYYGRVGYHNTTASSKWAASSLLTSGWESSATHSNWLIGIGAQYPINNSFAVRAELDNYFMTRAASIRNLNMALLYHF